MRAEVFPRMEPGADVAPRVREGTGGRHYPALDGLRGVAFLSVFAAHVVTLVAPWPVLTWGGWLGVDLFFVLSGFLITGILFDSVEGPRYFRNFYIRRALRIFPLYYSVWVVFLLLTPWLHPLWTRYDIGRLFYLANLMTLNAAKHPEINSTGFFFYLPGGHLTGFNVGHLWSLCLEEQFYLLWPLLIFLVRGRRRLMALCVASVLGSVVLNTALVRWAEHTHADRNFLYMATYAHVGPMLFGAWLALLLRGRAPDRRVNWRVYAVVSGLGVLVLYGAMGFPLQMFDLESPRLSTIGYLGSGLLCMGLVLMTVSSQGAVRRLLSQRWLTGVGKISYGLYLIHGFLLGAISHHTNWFVRRHVAFLLPVCVFAVAYGLATVSYRWLELPFLRLKDRWAPPLRNTPVLRAKEVTLGGGEVAAEA